MIVKLLLIKFTRGAANLETFETNAKIQYVAPHNTWTLHPPSKTAMLEKSLEITVFCKTVSRICLCSACS